MDAPVVEKRRLFGCSQDELIGVAREAGAEAFRGRQLAEWLYRRRAASLDAMTSLPKSFREALSARFEVGVEAPCNVAVSSDGTKKYLYAVHGGRFVETAWIPEAERSTLCVSTQSGCKMGCLFCMTAKQGFQAQLTAGEILNQYRSLPEFEQVDNLVYMGMGEPLDNLEPVLRSLEILTAEWGYAMSPRRITVSTVGLIPAMREFLARSSCHLAVSLHTPFDEERRRLMPVQNVYPVRDVLAAIRAHEIERQRRVSFEYILFKGLNDTPRHVKELARVLHGIRCRVNLIRFHPIPGVPLEPSDEPTVEAFMVALNDKGIRTTVRRSRGLDISAACGMLSTRERVRRAAPDF